LSEDAEKRLMLGDDIKYCSRVVTGIDIIAYVVF